METVYNVLKYLLCSDHFPSEIDIHSEKSYSITTGVYKSVTALIYCWHDGVDSRLSQSCKFGVCCKQHDYILPDLVVFVRVLGLGLAIGYP